MPTPARSTLNILARPTAAEADPQRLRLVVPEGESDARANELRQDLDAALNTWLDELQPILDAERAQVRQMDAEHERRRGEVLAFYQSLRKPIDAKHQPNIESIRSALQVASTKAALEAQARGCGGDIREFDAALDKAVPTSGSPGSYTYRVQAAADAFGL